MSFPVIQTSDIILPIVHPLGTEVETLNDILEHTSTEFHVEHLQEKQVQIAITEVQAVGIAGNLWIWVELSPLPTANDVQGGYWPWPLPISGIYWSAVGGGGGPTPPIVPVVIVPTGVNGATQTVMIAWAIHSVWARAVIQVPVAATPLTDHWTVQVRFQGKTP